MADPQPTILERLRGKRTSDIDLPNDNPNGDVDDRILADDEDRTINPLRKMAIRVRRMNQRTRTRASGRS